MKRNFHPAAECFCVLIAFAFMAVPGALARGKAIPGGAGRPLILMSLADPGPMGAAVTPAVFAHLAIGGGYSTVFTILNTGSTLATGSLILTDDNGLPLNATLQSAFGPAEAPGTVLAPNAPINIPPGGTQFITANALTPSDSTKQGWARIESDGGTLSGVATFQVTQGSNLASIAGVLGTTPVSVATIPVDDDASSNRFTGYAVANTGTQNISLRLTVVNSDGTVSRVLNPSLLNPLRPGYHQAGFLANDLNDVNLKLKGSLVISAQSGQSFAVVALVLNNNLFTAIPVIPSKAPSIP